MSDLTGSERRKLEKIFDMGGGYVLNFSDRTFADFFHEHSVEIDSDRYRIGGTSKANRMRTFWKEDSNHVVGRIVRALIDYGLEEQCLRGEPTLFDECLRIAQRLQSSPLVAEAQALMAIADERDFEVVARHVQEAIDRNQPEGALDRLHTFVIKYVRTICEPWGIAYTRERALHSVFGEYVRKLRVAGHLESVMTERILKSSISILEAFNDVRNNQSLAHDNPILNYEESLLIFNNVAASIRFIRALEDRLANKNVVPPVRQHLLRSQEY